MTSASPDLPSLRLRDIDEDDSVLIDELRSDEVSGEWDSFDDLKKDMLSGAHYGGGGKIIELPDGTAVGVVSWIQIPFGPNRRSLAWNIGITVLPEYRGRHYGAAAQLLVTRELFEISDVNRAQADTDVGNIAEQRSLEHAGFTREGIARGAQWRRGSWHDRVVYSLLRTDLDQG